MIRNFSKGRMNKSLDERLVPDGEYVDALNVRLGSTEDSEVGSIENAKGNDRLTRIQYAGEPLSPTARCIGAFEDGANETIYWFVHDDDFDLGTTRTLDMVVSYNTNSGILTYHVISMDDGSGSTSTLNFSDDYLIHSVNLIENILLWTDNYNPPRKIDVTKTYAKPNGSYVDQMTAEEILVIKKPPLTSPSIVPSNNNSEQNFLKNRFLCFGYRYKYANNEYSAISQFSEPAFIPGPFNFDINSYQNTGMENIANQVDVTYNSGSSLVKGIELLYKEMDDNIIKVIEYRDKEKLGLVDNTEYTYTFDNSKIYTVLPSSEILRLYDNVPLKAQTQTIMGNRLVYGNYVDGYDLVDANGNRTKFEYVTKLISEDIGSGNNIGLLSDGSYTIDSAQTITDSVATFNLSSVPLTAGTTLNFTFTFEHDSFSGGTPPTEITASNTIFFSYTLAQDFDSVYDLATSTDFVAKIGTASGIQTVANCADGATLTDIFNCSIPSSLDSLDKYKSGINGNDEPFSIVTTFASDNISLQIPAMRFVDNVSSPTVNVYEYYSITDASVSYNSVSNNASLHSNRDYEIGVVYMDEFNRASTALVSEENTVHVPCSASDKKNSIQVTIPTEQRAPSWATRYKFVIKESVSGYNTIYSNIFYENPSDNSYYFLLEGENARKVEEGDRLIVKADTDGPKENCTFCTVLEKAEKPENFISGAQTAVSEIGGVYMKIKPRGFVAEIPENNFIQFAVDEKTTEKTEGAFPTQAYTVNVQDPNNATQWNDESILTGSRVSIKIKFNRTGDGGKCERRLWEVDETFSSSKDYDNFKEWWDGENIADALATIATTDAGGDSCDPVISYNDTPLTGSSPTSLTGDSCTHYFQFFRQNAAGSDDGRLYLLMTGARACGALPGIGDNYRGWSTITTTISITKSNQTLVFETEPQEAAADIWYESSDSYSIDTSGNHSGNVQDQDISSDIPAIINLDFFNCFAFGNGVESYTIRDSIVGKPILLGNRVTSTSGEDFQQVERFADLTYSGVYNDETNVNKLNEFNLGLANFKRLEPLYGPVRKLFGRKTDILTLQEDKISYVLAEKNLLSDSTGGGQVVSIPEVLGKQIARLEEYGISNNPESFVSWGYDKYFTDAKRGAVLQLKGGGQQEQLNVISKAGMNPWFRDLFIDSYNTQKLGGYDPYMDEYVLSSNEQALPSTVEPSECGVNNTFTIVSGTNVTYTVDVGELVGDIDIAYNVISVDDTFTITATYNSGTDTTGAVSTSGTLTVSKDTVTATEIDIEISSSSGTAVVEVFVPCPAAEDITIIQVCVTDSAESGKTIHNEYRWTDGTFVSPLKSSPATFASSNDIPVRTQYLTFTGPQGAGFIPADGATVRVISNPRNGDDFIFNNGTDKFRYLRSSTLYENTDAKIESLLSASTAITPSNVVSDGVKTYGEFTMPTSSDQYLYLIYDYRNPTALQLCYSEAASNAACCDCGDCDCVTYEVYNKGTQGAIVSYTDCSTSSTTTTTIVAGGRKYICSETEPVLDSTSPSGSNIINRYRDCGCNSTYFENKFETGPNAATVRIGTEINPPAFTGATISSSDSPFAISSYTVGSGNSWVSPYYTPPANITLSGTSENSSVSFTISGTQNHTGTDQDLGNPINLKLTDGTNVYTASVSADASNNVVCTFNIGSAKNRTLRWVSNSYITIYFD